MKKIKESTHYASYEELLNYINQDKKNKKHLLLGNGFSIAYNKDIFSYMPCKKNFRCRGMKTLKTFLK